MIQLPTTPKPQLIHALFILNKNLQGDKNTHPLSVDAFRSQGKDKAYNVLTSGFGGTGNYAGTYRNIDEIIDAFNKIDDNTILTGGGYTTAKKKDYDKILDERENPNDKILLYPEGVLKKLLVDYNKKPREYWNEIYLQNPSPTVPKPLIVQNIEPFTQKKDMTISVVLIIITIIIVIILAILLIVKLNMKSN